MMAVLVGFVALAVDSARAFDSRRILQDSVDAAALAAAESFQAGATWGTAEAIAITLSDLDNRLYCIDNRPSRASTNLIHSTPVTPPLTASGRRVNTATDMTAQHA